MVVPLPDQPVTPGAAAFLWGKLPAHGDFVARGLSAEQQEQLDQWLSAGLAEAREKMGAEFDPAYDSAPPWRFVVPGPDGWRAGALAPSMDSVGRRYPLMVGLDGLAEDDAPVAAAACEDALFQAIAEGWSADRLAEALPAMPADDLLEPVRPDGADWWTLGDEHHEPKALSGEQPPALVDHLLQRPAEARA